MKINPVSFNKAQRTGLFGQAPPAFPRGRCLGEEGVGLQAGGGRGEPSFVSPTCSEREQGRLTNTLDCCAVGPGKCRHVFLIRLPLTK